MYCDTPIVRKEEVVTTRFSGETPYDSVVNHFGFDIEEEEDFKLWLDHRRIPIDSDRLPDEAVIFIEARKRLSNSSQHADPNHDKRSKVTMDVEDRHRVPSWIKSGRHG